MELQLLGLWSSGMVLQRDRHNLLTGRCGGNPVTVTFLEQCYTAVLGVDKGFSLYLPPLTAGGPYTMEVREGELAPLVLTDIYLGDLWLLGGQSNMELPLLRTLDCTAETLAGQREADIRFFVVEQVYTPFRSDALQPRGQWIAADTSRALECSAAGYFFARSLRRAHGIPIGLVQAAVGGTPIEAWMAQEQLTAFPQVQQAWQEAQNAALLERQAAENAADQAAWLEALERQDQGVAQDWRQGFDSRFTLPVPGMFRGGRLEDFCGSVWLQREFELPQDWQEEQNLLRLGAMSDSDRVYLNGRLVGETGYKYPPRKYVLPTGVLRPGRNRLVIRLVVSQGMGGLIPGKEYRLEGPAGHLPLAGTWEAAKGAQAEKAPAQFFLNRMPCGLFNGMIYPLRHLPIKGVAFYQGESNSGAPQGYSEKLFSTICQWRRLYGDEGLPFLYVQLANYDNPVLTEAGGFALLREEQRKAAAIHNTGMVVTLDIGEDNDLHPQDKITLGERLALLARSLVYGEKLVCHSPALRRAVRTGTSLRLELDHTGEGLVVKAGTQPVLEVAYSDGHTRQQIPTVAGNSLVLTLDGPEPLAVRYLFGDAPGQPTLYNSMGLPCGPFAWSRQ